MFNLEQKISEWRRQMLAAGVKNQNVLDELESHLREDVERQMQSGVSAEQALENAFQSIGQPTALQDEFAKARLGNPNSVRIEFKKLQSGSNKSLTIISWLWLGAALVMAALLASGKWMGFIFYAHCVSLTAGYGAAFVAGGFAICYVLRWRFDALSPGLQQAFGRAVFRFSRLSAGLVIVGLLLGMLWSRQHLGGYWGGGLREFGPMSAAIWLTSVWMAQQFAQVGERAALLLSLGGNVIVSLAWFGAGIIASHPRIGGLDMTHYWPLAVLLGIHLCFLAMGIAPARETAEP